MLKFESPLSAVVVTAALLFTNASAWAACRVSTPPQGWAASSLRWDGDCAGDLAHGLGILKEQEGASVKRMFLGRMSQGQLVLGVLDEPGQGVGAGAFRNGRLIPTEDRSLMLQAFEEAAKAASAAADRFERAGNTASARFYRSKATELREQLD